MQSIIGRVFAVAVAAASAACVAGPAPQSAASLDPAQPICRRATPTGSALAVKDCRTAAEWAEFEARARAGVEDTMRNTNTRGAS